MPAVAATVFAAVVVVADAALCVVCCCCCCRSWCCCRCCCCFFCSCYCCCCFVLLLSGSLIFVVNFDSNCGRRCHDRCRLFVRPNICYPVAPRRPNLTELSRLHTIPFVHNILDFADGVGDHSVFGLCSQHDFRDHVRHDVQCCLDSDGSWPSAHTWQPAALLQDQKEGHQKRWQEGLGNFWVVGAWSTQTVHVMLSDKFLMKRASEHNICFARVMEHSLNVLLLYVSLRFSS